MHGCTMHSRPLGLLIRWRWEVPLEPLVDLAKAGGQGILGGLHIVAQALFGLALRLLELRGVPAADTGAVSVKREISALSASSRCERSSAEWRRCRLRWRYCTLTSRAANALPSSSVNTSSKEPATRSLA